MSGILICADCGSSYRRITRASGEVVWRCADKVEKGKQSGCHNKNTIIDAEIKQLICEKLSLDEFDKQAVKDKIEQILISNDEIIIHSNDYENLENHVTI